VSCSPSQAGRIRSPCSNSRPAGGNGEAALVAKRCKALSIRHDILRWRGGKPASGIQAAAREARYRLLFAFAGHCGAGAVAVAHTEDDQAETVLFRLVSGSGIGGLGAMRARSQRGGAALLRPLLGVEKSRLVATLERRGIAFARDPSNEDPRFTRVRLRRLLPLLQAEGLSSARLLRLAERAARADEALETLALASNACVALEGETTAFAVRAFFELPAELGIRMLRRAVDDAGHEGPCELAKVESLYAMLAIAHCGKRPLRRTLAGALVSLSPAALRVNGAPARKSRPAKGLAKRRIK
jgi:tRNA(Ile)-lysidine synthase